MQCQYWHHTGGYTVLLSMYTILYYCYHVVLSWSMYDDLLPIQTSRTPYLTASMHWTAFYANRCRKTRSNELGMHSGCSSPSYFPILLSAGKDSVLFSCPFDWPLSRSPWNADTQLLQYSGRNPLAENLEGWILVFLVCFRFDPCHLCGLLWTKYDNICLD